MKKTLMLCLFSVAILAGLAGYIADTWLNIEFVSAGGFEYGPVITTIVIAICSSLAITISVLSYKSGQYMISFCCVLGFIFAVLWSAPVSLSRISSALETAELQAKHKNAKLEMLKTSYEEIKVLRQKEGSRSNGGCGPNCRDLIEKELSVLNQIAALKGQHVVQAGASNIAFIVPGLSAETIQKLIPFSAVFALLFLMNGFLAFGVNGIMSVLDEVDSRKKDVVVRTVSPGELKPYNPKSDIADSDPFIQLLKKKNRLSISELAELSGNNVPYVSLYISQLQKRGIVRKIRDGQKVRVSLIS